MKILYISPIKATAKKGDSTHFLEVGTNLQKFGNNILVICRGGRDKPRNLKVKYVPNVEIRNLITLITDFLLSLYLISYLLIFKPDVVYYRGVTLGGIVSRIFKVPSVAEANGIYPDEVRMERPRFFRFAGWILKFRERMIYFLATRVICVTDGIKRELVKNYRVEVDTCKVISNGVNTSLFKPGDKIACRKELGFEEDYFYLGFVGSFQPWQGLDTLVEAIKGVREQGYKTIRCVLVGDGDWMRYLKELVKVYGLQGEIIFIGRIRYEEVPAYINSLDVCLAPFKRERNVKIGLSPLKLYEYLACARPVIASRVNGVSEIVEDGDCGYLFEADDVEDLASRIIESYNERNELSELGNNGRTLVEKKFSWEKIARRVENVLREAVEANSRN